MDLDVVPEQLALVLAQRRVTRPLDAPLREALLHRLARPLEGAVGRGYARVEQGRRLLRRQAQHVAEYQHRALGRRQVLDGRQEGELNRLPGDHRRIRPGLGVGNLLEQLVRVGLQPGQVAEAARGRDRLRTAAVAFERVEAGVGRDPVEPGPKRRAPLEAFAVAPRAQVSLLEQVLGVLERAEHAVAVHLELAPVALEERSELGLVAGQGHHFGRAMAHSTGAVSSSPITGSRTVKPRSLKAPATWLA
jgi:hypothetical protein